jgi:hypothetical protein
LNNTEYSKHAYTAKHNTFSLACKYDDLLTNPNDQIKWYFNKFRIKSTVETSGGLIMKTGDAGEESRNKQQSASASNHHFTIVQKISFDTNTTVSILHIHNFNSKFNTGKYKCQYKGLSRTVRVYPMTKNGERFLKTFFVNL